MKNKRKPSSSQRNKEKISAAKYLKAQGILSKRTKLHGGKFISRSVLSRVNELEYIAKNNYKAVKVSPKIRKQAEERGVTIIRNRLIVPKGIRAEQRIAQGAVPGLIPVPGGQMLTVSLPYNTMLEFINALRSGEVDRLKLPREAFMFTMFGHFSRFTSGFRNGKSLADWLQRYPEETLENDQTIRHFGLYRMIPDDHVSLSFEQRLRLRNERKAQMEKASREHASRSHTKRVDEISGHALERRRAADRARKKEYREWLKVNDPAKYKAEVDRAKERSNASRARKKDK